MGHDIIDLLKETYENTKEVIDRFIAAVKKVMAFFDKEDENAEEAE